MRCTWQNATLYANTADNTVSNLQIAGWSKRFGRNKTMFDTRTSVENYAAIEALGFVSSSDSYNDFVVHCGIWWSVDHTVNEREVTRLASRWFHRGVSAA